MEEEYWANAERWDGLACWKSIKQRDTQPMDAKRAIFCTTSIMSYSLGI